MDENEKTELKLQKKFELAWVPQLGFIILARGDDFDHDPDLLKFYAEFANRYDARKVVDMLNEAHEDEA